MPRRPLMTLLCAAGILVAGVLPGARAAVPADKPTPTTDGAGSPPTETIDVDTAGELRDALANAKPGDVIQLADGTYEGRFTITVNGTADAPITLRGSRDAVLDGGDPDHGYGLHLDGADHWRLEGFTVTGSQKGVMADDADHNLIDGLYVHHIGDEAIHLRTHSSDNVVRNCRITDTGLKKPKYGEGIYFGSAVSNWGTYTNGEPDRSNRNKAINNTIGPGVTAEMIDIKEGTQDGVVRGNTFYGQDLCCISYNDSWVDVKGNGYLIADNAGTYSPEDGFQTHEIRKGWGRNNVFAGNHADVRGTGYGFGVFCDSSDTCGNVVHADNVVVHAESGYANIPVTPPDGGVDVDGDSDGGDNPPSADVACQVDYTVRKQWSDGFTADVRITNTGGTAINGWTLAWRFPDGQRVTKHWSSVVTQDGTSVTATNVGYNARIKPGATKDFGFNASHDGRNGAPIEFTVNGAPCDAT